MTSVLPVTFAEVMTVVFPGGFLSVFAVPSFVLQKTIFGRKVSIIDGNPTSADLVGVNSHKVTNACYVICPIVAGIAGLLNVGFIGTVDNSVGRG